jgi:hypothetical protein
MRILTPSRLVTTNPRSLPIHTSTQGVTFQGNDSNAEVFSKVFEYKAKLGQKLYLPNRTAVGNVISRGLAFIASLNTSANVEVSGNMELYIAVQSPTDIAPDFIARVGYQNFKDLSTRDQRDDTFRQRLAQVSDLNTDGEGGEHRLLTIPEDHALQIWVKGSTDVIDTTKSYIEFPLFEETK